MNIADHEVTRWEDMLKNSKPIVEKNHRGEWKPENFDREKIKDLAKRRKLSRHLPFEKIVS